ncbi:MAG: HypC/HybG/HupF family hydrogenase formation chaperone [Gammaproteobacteria bacterium]|nr:HypC/HybG/HupF family hydrogenase formation chaperone [Gammaproteobacteria bacterium]
MQVIESQGFYARCRGRNGEEWVNLMLVGPQPAGTWLLNFLGSAREVMSEEDALHANRAFEALDAVMAGETDLDLDHYFPGLRRCPSRDIPFRNITLRCVSPGANALPTAARSPPSAPTGNLLCKNRLLVEIPKSICGLMYRPGGDENGRIMAQFA